MGVKSINSFQSDASCLSLLLSSGINAAWSAPLLSSLNAVLTGETTKQRPRKHMPRLTFRNAVPEVRSATRPPVILVPMRMHVQETIDTCGKSYALSCRTCCRRMCSASAPRRTSQRPLSPAGARVQPPPNLFASPASSNSTNAMELQEKQWKSEFGDGGVKRLKLGRQIQRRQPSRERNPTPLNASKCEPARTESTPNQHYTTKDSESSGYGTKTMP
ncbi:hypothetical protein BC830DRAFT_543248 [Chytriomyces sp. MP71]|nr:hypothetical protein BC830DRAFT_543248 [Chytriomyces sp. MP71]